MPDARTTRSSGKEWMVFKRVERLAKEHEIHGSSFHRTRQPFTRLQDVLGQIRARRPITHPSHCQNAHCGKMLRDHYHRRADGFVLCKQCFEKLSWQT